MYFTLLVGEKFLNLGDEIFEVDFFIKEIELYLE